ncbi:MAG: choice-of-anchor J domain-containing protein [Bacteroidota bacterium]
MKRTIYLLASLLFLMWGCEPMEDTYEELDETEGAFSKNIEVALGEGDYSSVADIASKMGDEDAADFIDENHAFSEDAPAADYVPAFLSDEYIALKEGSRARVTFNYLTGYPDYVNEYQEGESSSFVSYQLTGDDYSSVGGDVAAYEMFFAADPPRSYLPGILNDNFPEAEEDDKVLALFDYSEEVSSSPTVELAMAEEDYQIIVDYVESNIENGSDYLDSYGTTEFYFGAASFFENFDLRLSKREEYGVPGFEGLSTEEGEALMEERVQEGIQIMLQEKYPDAKATIDGNQVYYIITYDTFDGSSGETYNVAYTVKEEGSPATFELVEGPTTEELAFSSASTISDGIYYMFDGNEWKAEEDVFYLSSEVYDEMGAPGNYDNFSSSEPPDNYIPQYLQEQITYAQEGDKVIVGYKYFSGGTEIRAGEYEFNGTSWENTSAITKRTEQFVHNGNEWVFDPTVVFTMSSDDYQLVVDYVQSNIENGASYVDSYGTTEYYYGASSYFENFDLRLNQKEEYGVPGYEGLSTEEAIQLSYDRMTEAVEIMLKEKYPDAQPTVNGVDVHYIVTVESYEDDLSRENYEYDFQCVSAGPDPEFELVSAPDFSEE